MLNKEYKYHIDLFFSDINYISDTSTYSLKCKDSSTIPFILKNIKSIEINYLLTDYIPDISMLLLKFHDSEDNRFYSNYIYKDIFIFFIQEKHSNSILWKTVTKKQFNFPYKNFSYILINLFDKNKNNLKVNFHIGMTFNYVLDLNKGYIYNN